MNQTSYITSPSIRFYLRSQKNCGIVLHDMKEIPSSDGSYPEQPKRPILGADSSDLLQNIPNWFRDLIAKSLGEDRLHEAEARHLQQLSQSIGLPYAVFAKELADAASSVTLNPNQTLRDSFAFDCALLANVCQSGASIAWLTRAYLRGFYVPSREQTNEFLRKLGDTNGNQDNSVRKNAEAVAVFIDGILPRPAQVDEETKNRLWNEFDDFLSRPIRNEIIAIGPQEQKMGGEQ
ncbi:hypothetical protein [Rubinisphaera italica]|uniref:Uncharacterized protein n=1 Tax=Rubinisphaera italica TaxID=2527969 RepID=A0A5C5XFV9_9PLAN|nr:hypothetical protein [Rubinisphaera italica]TWT61658.1 hypothetical protein Pan54_23950 [Rubinisphaera italica]